MIGVIADPSEEGVIREFFELFKTPWEFFQSNRRYEVLLCARDCGFDGTAKLALFYAGRKVQFDGEHDIRVAHQPRNRLERRQSQRMGMAAFRLLALATDDRQLSDDRRAHPACRSWWR